MRFLARVVIRVYQFVFSPMLHLFFGAGYGCRFSVSCSNYALNALDEFGTAKGLYMSLVRILNCHPFGKSDVTHWEGLEKK